MTLENQLAALFAEQHRSKTAHIECDGHHIPVNFVHGGPNATDLFVTFHGAVQQPRRKPPVFLSPVEAFSGRAHQLNVADPSIALDPEIRIAWYAGYQDFKLQDVLPRLFKLAQALLGSHRIIFLGNSGGGFAALHSGWHIPGSIVLTANPQTNILRYYPRHVRAYRNACWPDLKEDNDLSKVVSTNVAELYATRTPNTIIYQQSATDTAHIRRHMAPFIQRAHQENDPSIALHVDHFGAMGHTISFADQLPWIKAILLSKGTGLKEILSVRDTMRTDASPPSSSVPPDSGKPLGSLDPKLLRMTDVLRDITLKVR